MLTITKFNENEKLNGKKKRQTKPQQNTSHHSRWRNSLGNALNRRNRGIITILILPLVKSPGRLVLIIWKAVNCALKASVLFSWGLGYSGCCLSLVPQGDQVLQSSCSELLLGRLGSWHFKPQSGLNLSVWSESKLNPEEVKITEQKLLTLSILIPVRISNIILLHTLCLYLGLI